jgi:molybdate transport system ATP-binding protein
VTHDLDEAAQLASHLLLIDQGQLLQAGEITRVLTRPRNEQAAQLLDIPNVFEASVERTSSGLSQLRWGPHPLHISATGLTDTGRVKFAVLSQNILLVKRDKPWGSHLENPIPTVVQDVVTLGGEVLILLGIKGNPEVHLQMRLPERALRRYPIETGSEVTVCLRSSDIILLE